MRVWVTKMRSLRTADIDAIGKLAGSFPSMAVRVRLAKRHSHGVVKEVRRPIVTELKLIILASYRPGEAVETQSNPGTFVG